MAFSNIGNTRKIIFFLLCFAMLLFLIYVQYFATRGAKVFMGVWNIDKFFHFIGGVSLALLFEWISPRKALPYLVLLVAVVTSAWEVFEYVAFFDVMYFAHHSPELWRLDVGGDIVAAFLGSYGYWVFFRTRESSDSET